MRDLHVARAHVRDPVERHQEVVVVLELLADELLASRWFGETSHGSASTPEAQRLALAVEHDTHAAPRQVAHGFGVEVVAHTSR